MAKKRTNRGFLIYTEFKDLNGQEVRVQKSSSAGADHVWIFPEVRHHHVTGEPLAGAHLNKVQARRIIRALQRFIDGES